MGNNNDVHAVWAFGTIEELALKPGATQGGNKLTARTLNEKELKLLLLYIQTRKYAARDKAMALMTYWGSMRIGEVAAKKLGMCLRQMAALNKKCV